MGPTLQLLRHKRATVYADLRARRWAVDQARTWSHADDVVAVAAALLGEGEDEFWRQVTAQAIRALRADIDVLRAAEAEGLVAVEPALLDRMEARWAVACQVRDSSLRSSRQRQVDVDAVLSIVEGGRRDRAVVALAYIA